MAIRLLLRMGSRLPLLPKTGVCIAVLVKSFGLGWYFCPIRLSVLSVLLVASFLELPCCAGLTSSCVVEVSQGQSADKSHACPTVNLVTVLAGS